VARNTTDDQTHDLTPWELLGIDYFATERQVRTAYAQRLKVTRPEDDAAAFQRLVEARDAMMNVARRRAQEAAWEDEALGEEEAQDEAPALQVEPAPRPPVPESLGSSAGATGSLASAPAALPEAPGYSGSVTAAPASAAVPILPEAPGYSGSTAGLVPPEPEHFAVEEPDLSLDDLLDPIHALLGAHIRLSDLEAWPRLVGGLGKLHHDERSMASHALLEALPARIGTISLLAGPERRREFLASLVWGKPADWADDRKRAQVQADLLAALDEEFGWTSEDRQVFAVLDSSDANTVLTSLHGFARAALFNRDGAPPTYDGNGLPLFEQRDVAVFFGDTYYRYAGLLASSRAAGRWVLDWSFSRALMAPILALGHRHWEVLSAWAATLAFAIYVFNTPLPLIDALRQQLAAYTNVFTALALLPMAAVHAWYGAYGYSRHFTRLRRLVSSLDAQQHFAPTTRAMRLQRAATTGSGGQWIWPWQGTRFNKLWFVVVLALALVRILAMGQSNTPSYQPPSAAYEKYRQLADENAEVREIIKRRDAGELTPEQARKRIGELMIPNLAPKERFLDRDNKLAKMRAIEARRDAGELTALEARKLIDALYGTDSIGDLLKKAR
jgi:hypothetical protein